MSRLQYRYRQIFLEVNGPGPWPCYYGPCDRLVQPDELHVHHIDEDETNDDPKNLAGMHQSCHNRLHQVGKPRSAETRMKIAQAHKGKVLSPEHAAKTRSLRVGVKHTAETKAKMSATRLRLAAEKRAQ